MKKVGLHSRFYWTRCEHFPLLTVLPQETEKILVSRTGWLRGRITWTALSAAEEKPDGKASAVCPDSPRALMGLPKKPQKTFPYLWQNLQVAEMPAFARRYFVFLGISAPISVKGGQGLCLAGSCVHAVTPLQLTAFLDVCCKAETAKWGRAQFIPFPSTLETLQSIASKNLVLSMQMALIWQLLLPASTVRKVQGAKHGRITTRITSSLKEPGFLFFRLWDLKRDPVH